MMLIVLLVLNLSGYADANQVKSLPTNTIGEFGTTVPLVHWNTFFPDGSTAQWTTIPKTYNATDAAFASSNETDASFRYIYYAEIVFGELIGGILPEWTPHYSIHPSPAGQFPIQINFLDLTMEGQYELLILHGLESTQRGIHVAGTSKLVCNGTDVAVEGDDASAICSVFMSKSNYFQPVLTWTRGGEIVPGFLNVSSDPHSPYTSFSSRHDFNIRGEFNNSFTCTVTFRYVGPVLPDFDPSDPGYIGTCGVTFTDYDWSVRDTTIVPGSDDAPEGHIVLQVGHVLACSARGSQPIEYEWRFIQGNSNKPLNGTGLQSLNVSADMVGRDINIYQCVSVNYVLGVSREDFAIVKFIAVHGSGVYVTPNPVTVGFLTRDVLLPCTQYGHSGYHRKSQGWHVQWAAQFSEDLNTNLIYSASHSAVGIVNRWMSRFQEGADSHDLIVSNASPDLAGNYACIATDYPDSYMWQTELLLISPVKCLGPEQVSGGQLVELFCAVDFHGNNKYRPVLQWYNKEGKAVAPSKFISTGPPESIRNMIWQQHAFTASEQGSEEIFSCKVEIWSPEGFVPGTAQSCEYETNVQPSN